MGSSRVTFTLLLLFLSTIEKTTSDDEYISKNDEYSFEDGDGSEMEDEKYPSESNVDHDEYSSEYDVEDDKDSSEPEKESETEEERAERKNKSNPCEVENNSNPHESENESKTSPLESEIIMDRNLPGSDTKNQMNTPESEEEKEKNPLESKKDEETNAPESEEEKETNPSKSEEEKETNPPESMEEKETNSSESDKDKETNSHESDKEKETNKSESEKEKEMNPPESEKKNETNPRESDEEKETNPESEEEREINPPESDKEKETNSHESEEEKETNKSESEEEKETNPPEFENESERNPLESEKEKEINLSESEEEKETIPSESEEEKEKNPPESKKDKEMNPSESEEEKETNPPESEEEKERNPHKSEEEKERNPPESDEDKERNPHESDEENETNPHKSDEEKERNPYESEEEKETNPHKSNEEKETITSESEEEKETNPHESEEEKERNPHESEEEKERNPHKSEEEKEINPPDSEEEKETNPPDSEEEKETNPPESEEEKETNPPESEEKKETNPPDSEEEKETNPPESEEEKERNPHKSEEEKERNPPESDEDKERNPHESEEEKERNPHESEEEKERNPHESEEEKERNPHESEEEKERNPHESEEEKERNPHESEEEKERNPHESEEEKETNPPESEEEKETNPHESEEEKETNPPESEEEKETIPSESEEEKETNPPESEEEKETIPSESEEEKEKNPPESKKDKEMNPSESEEEKETNPPESEEEKERNPHKSEEEKERNPPESDEDKERNPHESDEENETNPHKSDEEKERNPYESEEEKETNPHKSDEEKERNPYESEEEKETNPHESNEEKETITSESEEEKETNPHESEEEKERNPHESEEEKERNPHKSEEEKEINPPDSEEEKETNPPDSEEEKETNPPESEEEKETNPPESEEKKETNPHDSEEEKETNPPDSEEEKETNPPESEEKKETNPPESEKKKETNPPESEEEKETNPPESEEEKETNPHESEEEKETNPPESEEEKETNPPESEEEKETNPPESEEEKETNPPESEEEKETNPPESEEEKERNPHESEEEKERNPHESEEEKETNPPESEEEKETNPPESEEEKESNPHKSEEEKERNPHESEEEKERNPHESEEEKETNPPESEEEKERNPPEYEEEKETNPPESEEEKETNPHESEEEKETNPPESEEEKESKLIPFARRPHPALSTFEEKKANFYLLAMTSLAVGGTNETFCITVNLFEPVSIDVNLEYNQNVVTLLNETSMIEEYHRCVPFEVPVITVELMASINIQINGSQTFLNKTKQILITPPTQLTLIRTDKPVYEPGQTVKFRIVSLDTNFFTYEQTFSSIEIKDPHSNRIGQWLNISTFSGLVDLSYPINYQAMSGYYAISVWDEKHREVTQTFEVKDYVPPTFEVTVNLPSTIHILDTNATLKVCAKFRLEKSVEGMVKATVCHKSNRYNWFQQGDTTPDICRNYTMRTDQTGCGLQNINLQEFALSDSRYEPFIVLECEVEQDSTGVTLTSSASFPIAFNIVTISFEDSPTVFKPRLTYEGRIKVTGPNSSPLKRNTVYLLVNYPEKKKSVHKLVTNLKGIAKFSLDTEPWGLEQVSLRVLYRTAKKPAVNGENQLNPQVSSLYLKLQPFYSPSQSFIKLRYYSAPLSCNRKGVIRAQYLIHNSTLLTNQKTISFFYMVMSKGHLVQNGHIIKAIDSGTAENRGNLVVTTMKNMLRVSPGAQVVLYTVLPSGEVVSDSRNVPVKLCFANKVSLKFSSSKELPGGQPLLTVKAAPGSLCSVRAIDQNLLLMQPERELSIKSVFNMLPVRTLSGYPSTNKDSNSCLDDQPIWNIPSSAQGGVDAYDTFKDIGIIVLTNADVQKPLDCLNLLWNSTETGAKEAPAIFTNKTSADSTSNLLAVPIRTYFSETWIWDLFPVSQCSSPINKTLPDFITTWQADAFCTSPIGFGVASKIELVTFRPFVVSLFMPSSVVQEEMLKLKATVFNQLQSCMMVKLTLADAQNFLVQFKNFTYTSCLCVDESWTVSWIITPLVLGEVNISVTAEAIQSVILCGENEVIVPEKGNTDTVTKTLLVQAEGTKQYKIYNELFCLSEGTEVEKMVSLTLPEVFIEDSAMSSVSVMGDLMGRALQNLGSLLEMPSGCGEQNILHFAPNIFILQYLKNTNQLTLEILNTAQTYLVRGYQNELTYRHTDGSYSAFGMDDALGNTWLTAFVMKSFGSAMRHIFIDQVFVDQAKFWLSQQQQSNGCFASVGQLFHTDLKGGVNDEVTLSAYITAAMLELNYTITDPVVNNSLTCLRNAYTQVNSTYARALLFYTFTLAEDQMMRRSLILDLDLVTIISGGGRHWNEVSNGALSDSLQVEMTAYVLLALMSGSELHGFDLDYSTSIVHWLSQQQNAFGGFVSRQDTVVALQALAKYSQVTYNTVGVVTVTVTSLSGLINTFTITQCNRLLNQERQLEEVPEDYSIKAEGEGCVYMQFTLSYNIPPPLDHSAFSISASASGNCSLINLSLEVTITVRYNGQHSETNMVVIDVKLLSGFRVDMKPAQFVDGNSNSTDGTVKHVDQTDGEAIIYVNGLKNGKEKVYTLTINQKLAVENLKPAIVKVYDYYNTAEKAAAEYSSPCPVQ